MVELKKKFERKYLLKNKWETETRNSEKVVYTITNAKVMAKLSHGQNRRFWMRITVQAKRSSGYENTTPAENYVVVQLRTE